MSGFLFLLAMDWVMRRTTDGNVTGIRWKFTSKLKDLDFADDVALMSSTRQHMQNKSKKLEEESERVGLKIKIDKTKIMKMNPKNNDPIILRGQEIEGVNKFTHFGGNNYTRRRRNGGPEEQNNQRLVIHLPNWGRSGIITKSQKKNKIKLFKTLVTPVLLYGCKTWNMNKEYNKLIDTFQNECLRKILKIRW